MKVRIRPLGEVGSWPGRMFHGTFQTVWWNYWNLLHFAVRDRVAQS